MSLSIADFQKISNGYHNAGDITLTLMAQKLGDVQKVERLKS